MRGLILWLGLATAACGSRDPNLKLMAADPDACLDNDLRKWIDTFHHTHCEWRFRGDCTNNYKTMKECVEMSPVTLDSRQRCTDGCDARRCIDFFLSSMDCSDPLPAECTSMFAGSGCSFE